MGMAGGLGKQNSMRETTKKILPRTDEVASPLEPMSDPFDNSIPSEPSYPTLRLRHVKALEAQAEIAAKQLEALEYIGRQLHNIKEQLHINCRVSDGTQNGGAR